MALAILAGGVSGLVASLMGGATHWLHLMLFGPGAEYGLSAMRNAAPFVVFLMPIIGGLLLGLLNLGLARWWPRPPIDPIEANALYGGRLSLADGAVVGAQNIVSNGFGASVGLEAAYAQAGGGLASRLGEAFGLRRADLRVLVGCGAAGAIAAAFGAPVTGAFYAFELIIGSYTIANLAPVMASAVAGSLVAGTLGGVEPLALLRGIGTPVWSDYGLALLLGILCGLVGIALMRSMSLVEVALRHAVPWAALAAGGGRACGRRAGPRDARRALIGPRRPAPCPLPGGHTPSPADPAAGEDRGVGGLDRQRLSGRLVLRLAPARRGSRQAVRGLGRFVRHTRGGPDARWPPSA